MERDRDWLWRSIALAAVAIICALAIRLWTGYPGNPKGENSLNVALAVVTLIALGRFLIFLWSLWKDGNDRPIAAIRAALPEATLAFLPIAIGVVAIGAFLFSLNYLKSMITAFVPFWADGWLAATDRYMFVDPQAIALAIHPSLPALGFFYGLWHAAHLGGILWVIHWRKPDKARHIVSFMLSWLIGMFLAYVFSSAGPIFVGLYDPAIAPESVRKPAEILWANYQAGGALVGGGISAFPSMHVAIAAWLAIVLRDRGFTWVGATYLLGVFVCSVVLGWHYVLDGVAGIGIALLADRLSLAWLRSGTSARGPIGQPVVLSN
jgi:hypothetical protein